MVRPPRPRRARRPPPRARQPPRRRPTARRGAAAGRARSGASPRGAAAAPAPPRRRRARGRPPVRRRPRRRPCTRPRRSRARQASPWRRWRSPSTQVAFRGFVVIMIAPRLLLIRWQGRLRRSRGGPRRSRGCSAAGGLELAGFAGVFRSPCLPIFGVTSKAEPRQFEKDLLSARPGANRSPRALVRQWACITSDSRPLICIDGRLWT